MSVTGTVAAARLSQIAAKIRDLNLPPDHINQQHNHRRQVQSAHGRDQAADRPKDWIGDAIQYIQNPVDGRVASINYTKGDQPACYDRNDDQIPDGIKQVQNDFDKGSEHRVST